MGKVTWWRTCVKNNGHVGTSACFDIVHRKGWFLEWEGSALSMMSYCSWLVWWMIGGKSMRLRGKCHEGEWRGSMLFEDGQDWCNQCSWGVNGWGKLGWVEFLMQQEQIKTYLGPCPLLKNKTDFWIFWMDFTLKKNVVCYIAVHTSLQPGLTV